MKQLILMLLLFTVVACEDERVTNVHKENSGVIINNQELQEYTIDGCEYIVNADPASYRFAITHKGNCSNPIHICKPKTDTIYLPR